jgi:hypothetical protein
MSTFLDKSLFEHDIYNENLVGPITITKQISTNIDLLKEIIILGDLHDGLNYKCKPNTIITKVQQYIPNLIKNTNKFIDIFLEWRYQFKNNNDDFNNVYAEMNLSYISEVAKVFKNCIYNNTKCPYKNIRVHFTDFRGAKKVKHPLDILIYDVIPKIINLSTNKLNNELDKIHTYILRQIIPIFDDPNGLAKYYWNYFMNNNEFELSTTSHEVKQTVLKYLENYFKDKQIKFEKVLNNFDNILVSILEEKKYLDSLNQALNILRDEYLPIDTVVLDIYIFVNIFKIFKDLNNIQSTINNAIIFVGDAHATAIRKLLEIMKFKLIFKKESNNRCIDIKNSEPWF